MSVTCIPLVNECGCDGYEWPVLTSQIDLYSKVFSIYNNSLNIYNTYKCLIIAAAKNRLLIIKIVISWLQRNYSNTTWSI